MIKTISKGYQLTIPAELRNEFGLTIGSKGQITIPKKVREYLRVVEGDNIVLMLEHEKVVIESGKKEFKI